MKILHLDIEGGFGGSSRSLRYLVEGLAQFNVKSEVWHAKVGPSYRINQQKGVNSKINKNIVSIIPLKKNNLKNFLFLFFKLLKLPLLALEIKRKKIDILHLNYEGLLPLALLLRLINYKKAIVVHVRTPLPNNFFSSIFCKLFKYVDGAIFISIMERKFFKNVTKDLKIKYIINNNPAPAVLINANIKKKNAILRAIFLGNIDQTKAPDRIIELAKYTKKLGLPIRYYLYGKEKKSFFNNKKTVNENYLINSIKEQKLGKTVFFKGFTSNPEEIICNSDILIRPSRNGDAWGRDIIEGMAAGLLIVASGKEKVFIKHKYNGLLYENWDVEIISNMLKKIIYDKNRFLQLRMRARKFAKDNFTIKKHSRKTIDFFKKLN